MRFEYSSGAFVYRRSGKAILFLILERRKGRRGKEGTPDLPKGHIEKGESAIEAARREIVEETGIEPRFMPSFMRKTRYFFRDGGETVRKELTLFIAEAGAQKVRLSPEHSGYQWLDYGAAMRRIPFKDIRALLPSVSEYIRRWEEMRALNDEYRSLPGKRAGWALSARHVPGEGRLDARIMLVGQAPGRNEDVELRPFVGRSGRLLDRVLKGAGIRRDDAYITSVVQFFPPDNRLPTRDETDACKGFLFRQIRIVKPRLVIVLGNLAGESLLGIGRIETNHGRIVRKDGIAYMMTFHPAAALRSTTTLRLMERDLKGAKKAL